MGSHIADTTGHGINVTKSAHILIEDDEVSGGGKPALATPAIVARGISLATTTDSIVQRNNVHDNSDSGIFLGAGATGNLIENNSSSNNARGYARAAVSIDVRGATNRGPSAGTSASTTRTPGSTSGAGATGCVVTEQRQLRQR